MVQAYKVYRQKLQTGYEGDVYDGRMLLVFPEARVKVAFDKWHFAVPRGQVSFIKNIDKLGGTPCGEGFGKNDIGLEKLTELSPEEWAKYMQHEVGWFDYEYGYIPIVVDDKLIELLEKKVERSETKFDREINKQLKKIIFNE